MRALQEVGPGGAFALSSTFVASSFFAGVAAACFAGVAAACACVRVSGAVVVSAGVGAADAVVSGSEDGTAGLGVVTGMALVVSTVALM